jgi:hypothetical protein
MIDILLNDFIDELDPQKSPHSQAIQQETYYAAIQGDFERYMRWKFLNFIYKNQTQGNASTGKKPKEGKTEDPSDDFTISLESFDRNDMIFKCGNDIHFVEWKAMTLPVRNQDNNTRYQKQIDNFRQLCKSCVKLEDLRKKRRVGQYYKSLSSHFWSVFVYVDFQSSLINKQKAKRKRFFERHGNFQKYGSIGNHNNKAILPNNISKLDLGPYSPFNGEVYIYFEWFDFSKSINNNSSKIGVNGSGKLLFDYELWDEKKKEGEKKNFEKFLGNAYATIGSD